MSLSSAKFSEITGASIRRSIQQLTQPDKKLSDAVDVRSELDLRIGEMLLRLFYELNSLILICFVVHKQGKLQPVFKQYIFKYLLS